MSAARHSSRAVLREKKRWAGRNNCTWTGCSGKQMRRKRCQSTRRLCFSDVVPPLHPQASPQMHHARLLLELLPRLDCQRFSRLMRRLHNSHPSEGPASVSWMCSTMARRLPAKEKKQMLETADRLMGESVAMRKVGKLWSSETAWEAVHGKEPRTLPRYHSSESFFAPSENGRTSAREIA